MSSHIQSPLAPVDTRLVVNAGAFVSAKRLILQPALRSENESHTLIKLAPARASYESPNIHSHADIPEVEKVGKRKASSEALRPAKKIMTVSDSCLEDEGLLESHMWPLRCSIFHHLASELKP